MKNERKHHTLLWVIIIELLVLIIGIGLIVFTRLRSNIKENAASDVETEQVIQYELITEAATESMPEFVVPMPEISEQLLTINDWSRPGKKIKSLDYIVIHYLGNPKTTAQENHDYFESLKDLQNISMSANYVIGLEGEIIHCVPDDEVAYASNQANSYSLSIENCHPDETGRLNEATYDSLVKLTAYLTDQYNLSREQIIRHYDVTGKDCPRYYVENEDLWEQFKDDVMAYRSECEEQVRAQLTSSAATEEYIEKDDELSAFLQENAAS